MSDTVTIAYAKLRSERARRQSFSLGLADAVGTISDKVMGLQDEKRALAGQRENARVLAGIRGDESRKTTKFESDLAFDNHNAAMEEYRRNLDRGSERLEKSATLDGLNIPPPNQMDPGTYNLTEPPQLVPEIKHAPFGAAAPAPTPAAGAGPAMQPAPAAGSPPATAGYMSGVDDQLRQIQRDASFMPGDLAQNIAALTRARGNLGAERRAGELHTTNVLKGKQDTNPEAFANKLRAGELLVDKGRVDLETSKLKQDIAESDLRVTQETEQSLIDKATREEEKLALELEAEQIKKENLHLKQKSALDKEKAETRKINAEAQAKEDGTALARIGVSSTVTERREKNLHTEEASIMKASQTLRFAKPEQFPGEPEKQAAANAAFQQWRQPQMLALRERLRIYNKRALDMLKPPLMIRQDGTVLEDSVKAAKLENKLDEFFEGTFFKETDAARRLDIYFQQTPIKDWMWAYDYVYVPRMLGRNETAMTRQMNALFNEKMIEWTDRHENRRAEKVE